MDGAGFERAVLLGWSIGVDVALSLPRGPRTSGGDPRDRRVSGGLFRAFGPPGPPRPCARAPSRAAWLLRLVGPPAAALAYPTVNVARALGVDHVAPLPDLASSTEVARQFATHPWTWYSELLLAAGDCLPIDTSFVSFPVTLVGGTLDIGVAATDIRAVTMTIPQARFVPLVGTHFLPLEQPHRLHQELIALADRAGLPRT